MRKNILYIGGFELPDKNAAAHRVINNAKALQEIGHKVIFINSLKNKTKSSNKYLDFDIWNINYPNSVFSWVKYLISIKNIKKIIKRYQKIDVIIAYNYPALALLNLYSFCKRNNIKLVSDCTEWYSSKGRRATSRIFKDLDTTFRMRVVNKKIDGIIVISNFMEKFYTEQNTVLVPPLIDLNDEKWSFRTTDINNSVINLVYAGSPEKEKDKINLVVESLYENKDLEFTFKVVGITENEYLEMYPNHKENIQFLKEKIQFLGRVPHQDALRILSKADFSIYLRKSSRMINAGFPTKFVESITMGVPSITTNISDLKRYMIDKKNGFFIDIESGVDFKKTVKKILEMSPKEVKDLKLNCKGYDEFHYQNHINNFKDFFEKL